MRTTLPVEQEIVDLETTALRRWAEGDPDGFLHICAHDIVYFDPFHEHRVDGLPALTELYESLRGQVRIDRFEIIDPRVTVQGDFALLTFNFRSFGELENRWNATEVYRREGGFWKLIHSHWSITRPQLLEPGV